MRFSPSTRFLLLKTVIIMQFLSSSTIYKLLSLLSRTSVVKEVSFFQFIVNNN